MCTSPYIYIYIYLLCELPSDSNSKTSESDCIENHYLFTHILDISWGAYEKEMSDFVKEMFV